VLTQLIIQNIGAGKVLAYVGVKTTDFVPVALLPE
jgi:hypothetical protein